MGKNSETVQYPLLLQAVCTTLPGWPGVSSEQVFEKDGSFRISGNFFTTSGFRPWSLP